MNRISLTLTLLSLFLFLTPAAAQKKRPRGASAPAASVSPQRLMEQYRFDEAAAAFQRELAAERKAGRDTHAAEDGLRRALLGADMLRGTQRVLFVDSVKTTRGQMLPALRLGKGCGTLSAATDITETLDTPPAGVGRTAYTNAIGDKAYFAAAEEEGGERRLAVSYLTGSRWSAPAFLPGLDSIAADMDCPFVMPDGVTLYFAAEGGESLGGYDLFVTRYNTEAKSFLKAENLGMPFNSPANDYLLAIDEERRLGWLVTDRNQTGDTVCVYVFVPEEVYPVCQLTAANAAEVRGAAMIAGIAATQAGVPDEARKARGRLAALGKDTERGDGGTEEGFYVINDSRVYGSLLQFRSERARGYAMQADEALARIRVVVNKIDLLQRAAVKGARTYDAANMLSDSYNALPALYKEYRDLCKKMRRAELKETGE